MTKFDLLPGFSVMNQWNTYHYVHPSDTENVWFPCLNEDVMEYFWEWLTYKPPYPDAGRKRAFSIIKWLLDNRIHFLIETKTMDIIDHHTQSPDLPIEEWAYSELVSWVLVIPDDNDAMLIKLVWGGK